MRQFVLFAGATFEPVDFDRLANNQQRVFALMLDGKWKTQDELREVGGSAWDSRVRALRRPVYGSLVIETERLDGGAWRYRLDTTSVTAETRRRILEWDLPPAPKRAQATHDPHLMTMQVDEEQAGAIADALRTLVGVASRHGDYEVEKAGMAVSWLEHSLRRAIDHGPGSTIGVPPEVGR